jgi:UTP--glucose-1-phosphate uridylyltransferase
MKVTTAIITAAGYGSRMLPVTAAVQKELLPILDRPVIDYVVADCVAAGVTKIIFIISPGSHGLQDYYVGNAGLQAHLKRFGKTAALEKLEAVHSQATFNFVEQPETAGYGTAVPLNVAAPHLPKGEAFVFSNGDIFTWNKDGYSDTAGLVAAFERTDAIGAIAVLPKPEKELHRYGTIGLQRREGNEYLTDFVEQPGPGQAPSNLINLSNYVFSPEILPYVKAVKPGETGESRVTDAVLAAAQVKPFVVYRAKGQFLDAGNLKGWLEANIAIAAK